LGKLPVLKPREVVALLAARGFVLARQKGSHMQFRHPDGRATTVPDHGGRDISPALLRAYPKPQYRCDLWVKPGFWDIL
jgi:predicted RNA binding protein YcfA (HicA-like mRNA interferase family)